ncbi:MAG: hypothetical protein EP343_31645 [Deltaproteobacteria bacterium]|nr:MAG: hypothetical protein EP343_31645 [Deltaproteobacteria bacterium]
MRNWTFLGLCGLLVCGGLFFQCSNPSSTDESGTSQDGGGNNPDISVAEKPTATKVAGCGQDIAPASSELTLTVGGVKRTATLYVPKGYDKNKPIPLVVNFHGGGSNAPQQQIFSLMDEKADKEGFLVLYPNGSDTFWNVRFCCGEQKTDDVEATRAWIDEIKKKACVDSKRVYATGMSNGGHMAYRIACEAPDLFAAIAPVAGLTYSECTPSQPIPILHFHGTEDKSVPYDGGKEYTTGEKPFTSPKIKDMVGKWAERNGCGSTPKETFSQGQTQCETYESCKNNATVTLCTSQGVGHCWPGNTFCVGGKSTQEINANDTMWTFFQQYTLP